MSHACVVRGLWAPEGWGKYCGRARCEHGITPHSIAYIAKLAVRAKVGKDKTRYGVSRTSTTSFFIHHVQRISLAAIVGDAWQIRRSITEMKMKVNAGKTHTAAPGKHRKPRATGVGGA